VLQTGTDTCQHVDGGGLIQGLLEGMKAVDIDDADSKRDDCLMGGVQQSVDLINQRTSRVILRRI
jgi:hypothetical protein